MELLYDGHTWWQTRALDSARALNCCHLQKPEVGSFIDSDYFFLFLVKCRYYQTIDIFNYMLALKKISAAKMVKLKPDEPGGQQ